MLYNSLLESQLWIFMDITQKVLDEYDWSRSMVFIESKEKKCFLLKYCGFNSIYNFQGSKYIAFTPNILMRVNSTENKWWAIL